MIKKLPMMSLLIILSLSFIFNALALTDSEQNSIITGDTSLSRAGMSTYLTGALNMSFSTLQSLVGGGAYMNFGNFCQAIEQYFIPLNQRLVGLFVGWDQHANTNTTDIPYYEWVEDWLSACDQYGIGNLFYFGQWGTSSPAPSWWSDVLEAYPDIQTYDRYGLPVGLGRYNPISIDHPQLIEQLKEDLKQLWEYYGEHPSWIGWGSFPGDSAYYAPSDSMVSKVGFANYSIVNFAKTPYYLRDLNGTGFHADGTRCKIWESFLDYTPFSVLGYGVLQDSHAEDVFGGKEETGMLVAMNFKAPENLDGFKIKWYGKKIGVPTAINLELYEDEDDLPKDIGNPIESVIQRSEEISTTQRWQPSVSFTSNLIKDKYYWIVFQSAGGDGNNKFQVYVRIFKTDESTSKTSTDGYFPRRWNFEGSSILWIQDAWEKDKKIYPWQKAAQTPNVGNLFQIFTPTRDMTINTVFLQVADRPYDDVPSIVQLVRSKDGMVLAEGLLDSKLVSGLWHWVPVVLDKRIGLSLGEQYSLNLLRTKDSPWQWHYLETDPLSEGFQGQKRTFLFRLSDMNLPVYNFVRCNYPTGTGTETGQPGITDTDWCAVRLGPTKNTSLSTVDVKIWEKYGTPADLKIAIREDYDGTGSRPAEIDFDSKILPAAEIPQSRSWLNTTEWNTPLKADNWYWIVFSAVAPSEKSGYRFYQTVNPKEYKFLWTSNNGSLWEIGREVAELIFKVTTTTEVFKVEPEDAQFSGGPTIISDKDFMAQSFSVPSNLLAKGILAFVIRASSDPGGNLTVELRRDSGMDTPSMVSLTSGNLSLESIARQGIQFIDFNFPFPLMANKKYWIVLRSTDTARIYSPYYVYREPEDSFGGTEYKAKRSSDGGSSWELTEGRETDIIFGIVEPNEIADTSYGIKDLSNDLANYHTFNVSAEPLHGWNTYLNLQTSRILKETIEWFEAFTGRRWHSIDVNPVRMIEEVGGQKYLFNFDFNKEGPRKIPPSEGLLLNDTVTKLNNLIRSSCVNYHPLSSLGHLGSPMGGITSEQIGSYYRSTLPILARAVNLFDWDFSSFVDENQQEWSRKFGEILSRMKYNGGYYGSQKGVVNALFIGDMDIGITLQFLTPALNITLHGFSNTAGDFNLTSFGNFEQFNVIVWWSKGPSMEDVTENVQERIKQFVHNGGGLVAVNGWPDWLDSILGFEHLYGEFSFGNLSYVNYTHPIIRPYSNISGYSYYWRNYRVIPYRDDPGEYVVRDTNGVPWISEHTYGSGRAVFCGISSETWHQFGAGAQGSPREGYLVLLNNAVFYAAKREEMLPTWWFTDYQDQYLPWHTQLWYSINGIGGEPVLLWLTNNGEATNFELHLNATFYDIDPNGWIAIEAVSWTTVARGNGTDIKIETVVPEKSWKPIYICSQADYIHEIYSNIFVLKRVSSPVQVAYTLKGPRGQASWLIVNNTRPVSEVTLNESNIVPMRSFINGLNASETTNGWFQDPINEILYIKFKPSTTTHIIRINFEIPVPIYERYPYLIPVAIIVVVAAVEVAVLTKQQKREELM